MYITSFGYVRNRAPNVVSIFNNGVIILYISQGKFVSQRYLNKGFDGYCFISFHNPAVNFLSR